MNSCISGVSSNQFFWGIFGVWKTLGDGQSYHICLVVVLRRPNAIPPTPEEKEDETCSTKGDETGHFPAQRRRRMSGPGFLIWPIWPFSFFFLSCQLNKKLGDTLRPTF